MTLADISQVLAVILSLMGAAFLVVAGVGVIRLPDAYCRSHALGKATTLGICCLLLAMGLAIHDFPWWKVFLAICFQLVTIPVASHLFCLIAYKRGIPHWRKDN